MTSQFLIVKIQSILSGASGTSDDRSLALEYRKKCAEAVSRLEHCVSLIRAGRDYAALQVAETEPKLLESINELSFKDCEKWRAYCAEKLLPQVVEFDASLVSQVQSLYTRGITEAHPLYRDYRRAMRMRDMENALAIMLSIKRVNSFDAEAKREYARLLERAKNEWLDSATAASDSGDGDKLGEACRKLEPYAGELTGDERWTKVSAKFSKLKRENAERRCLEILEELRKNPEDAANMADEISELEILKSAEGVELSAEDEAFAASCAAKASENALKEARKEDAIRAKDKLLSLSSRKDFASMKFADLLSMYKLASPEMTPEENKKIASKISSIKLGKFLSRAFKTTAVAACIAVACILGFNLWNTYNRSQNIYAAIAELSVISSEEDFSKGELKLADFEERNADILSEPRIESRVANMRGKWNEEKSLLSRAESAISHLEKSNLKKASEKDLEKSKKTAERALSEIALLPEVKRLAYSDRLTAYLDALSEEISARKAATSKSIRRELDEYEKVATQYEVFGKSMSEVDAKVNNVIRKLSPMIEKSGLFAAHKGDIARFDAITARIAGLRQSAMERDAAREKMSGADSLESYFLGLENLASGEGVGASIEKAAQVILEKKAEIAQGQLAEFGGEIPASFTFPKSDDIYNGELLHDVWVYSCGKKTIYTAGEISERKRPWSGGSDILQEVNEIYMGGKIIKNTYRKTLITGKTPRGEILESGKITLESKLGDAAAEVAKSKSVLASITTIANAKVNAIYKARLESKAFQFMRSFPSMGGVAFSPSARARMEKVEKLASDIADYSWMFESVSREKQLAAALYSSPLKNFTAEAESMFGAIKILSENRAKFAGYIDADGNPVYKNKSKIGTAQWAVSKDGKFMRFESGVAGEELAPFSPIMNEVVSTEEARKRAAK